MNLSSAIYGSLAVGMATWLTAELSASTLAGIAAGLFLAFSYTFWSQAITAEVYTLHLLMTGVALFALLEWEKRQTVARLLLFYAVYALGFGNHLSMILLLPGLALFLLMHRRPGPGDPLAPRMIVMAIVIAMAGALQYVWNFRALWWELEPPESLREALSKFWFDVTKADWRETLVMSVSESGLRTRPAMYWWDLRQQFGRPGIVLAVIGFGYLLARWPRRAVSLLVLYLTALTFAWTYNVGDAYIFFLPSHYVVALCAGAGVAALMWLARRFPVLGGNGLILGVLCLLYPAWRGYDNFPALDRSWDTRAVQMFDRLSSPPFSQQSFCGTTVFGLDANWQVQNAAEYYMDRHKPEVAWFATNELEWLTPANTGGFARFVDDNYRHVIFTADVLRNVTRIDPSPLPPLREDSPPSLADAISHLAKGSGYALAVLRPDSEFPIDRTEFQLAWTALTGDAGLPATQDYTVFVGRVGERPLLMRAGNRPFRVITALGPLTIDVRMESWLPTDTIRRSGFGHIIANRRHVLAIDRGISLVALAASGIPLLTEYRSGLFAPVRRWVVNPGDTVAAPCYR
jgi:transmembrane protein TMEM260 (protein O-mannosyltransferase)